MTKLHIFSSHRWAYGEHRDGLHDLLRPWAKNIDLVDLPLLPIIRSMHTAIARSPENS